MWFLSRDMMNNDCITEKLMGCFNSHLCRTITHAKTYNSLLFLRSENKIGATLKGSACQIPIMLKCCNYLNENIRAITVTIVTLCTKPNASLLFSTETGTDNTSRRVRVAYYNRQQTFHTMFTAKCIIIYPPTSAVYHFLKTLVWKISHSSSPPQRDLL